MDYLTIGKLVNTQGIKGEVRVQAITDFPKKRFKVGASVYAFPKGKQDPIKLVIKSARKHKKFILLSFEGMDSINDVEYLKPSELKIKADQQDDSELTPGAYYYHQIIGLSVYDLNHNLLGTITDIMELGSNDVWVVARKNKNDLLLPKIDDVIKKVDLENNEVTVDLLEGLD